jgi:hypothetical protein
MQAGLQWPLSPMAEGYSYPFSFSSFDSNQFKFGISYQFEYCSKIYETNSVRFLNLSSIKEKYQTKQ